MSSTPRRRRGKAKEEERPAKKEGAVEEVEEEVRKVERAVGKEVRKVEKAVERKTEPKASPLRPEGRAPQAMVEARHGTGMITRAGRGFSLGELSGGGLTPGLAARWGVRVDARRRSVLEGNVGSLRAWHATGAKARVEHEAREVEAELGKVGREVRKEVVAVEKEAVKAEKAVRKGAKRAEKAVKEKVEKRKARPKKKS